MYYNYRCLVPECEDVKFNNDTSFLVAEPGKYEPPWLQNVLPFDTSGKVSQCTRYKLSNMHMQQVRAAKVEDPADNQCSALKLPTNETEKCDVLIYKTVEKTIVNEV